MLSTVVHSGDPEPSDALRAAGDAAELAAAALPVPRGLARPREPPAWLAPWRARKARRAAEAEALAVQATAWAREQAAYARLAAAQPQWRT